ncbi:MAG: hypothetical protein RLY31_1441 [Bacteroidota bacterium]|jgi:predicted NAD/FAD-dependent oxidoreductase
MTESDVLVVGAGIAGLTAARTLTESGRRVVVLDKSRGPGGRMATRRDGEARWDHGAQYFSTRTPAFRALAGALAAERTIQEWKPAHLSDPYPRYIGTGGMNAVPKSLAAGLDVRCRQQVVRLRYNTAWEVVTAGGEHYSAGVLVLAIPAPQASALLTGSGLDLPAVENALAQVAYHPCLAVLAWLDRPADLPFPGGLALQDHPVAWLADHTAKGISTVPTLIIHAAPDFSTAHLDGDLEQAGRSLADAARPLLGGAAITRFQVHRWRYSLAFRRHPDHFFHSDAPGPLFIGGDGFGPTGHVEGAFLSGMALARAILERP